MTFDGAELFDDDRIFRSYQSGRHRVDSPNETLEKPVFLEMIGDVSDKRILDLGCGDGLFAIELLAAGCCAYAGLEASGLMVQLARLNLQDTSAQVFHTRIEDWCYPAGRYDLVISRLALHYVANLAEAFDRVHETLAPNGKFVFSIVHPLITACDKSRAGGGARQDWIVDDYFIPGSRHVRFMGESVEQYHRTIEEIYRSFQDASFQIEHLRESCPQPEYFVDESLYERRKRIPLFLLLSGTKR